MLELQEVEVYYGSIRALKGVSLTVADGELVTLIGANGAGKSTTLRAISSLLHPRSGKITYHGETLNGLAPHRVVALGISHCPEGRHVFGGLTVEENLRLGAVQRKDRGAVADDIERSYSLFPRLKERRRQLGGTLSGGEQQMLAISRALMSRPKLLLLDEPSLGLAPLFVEMIFETIRQLKASKYNHSAGRAECAPGAGRRRPGVCTGKRARDTVGTGSAKLQHNPDVEHTYLGT